MVGSAFRRCAQGTAHGLRERSGCRLRPGRRPRRREYARGPSRSTRTAESPQMDSWAYLRDWSEAEIFEQALEAVGDAEFRGQCDGCRAVDEARAKLKVTPELVEQARRKRRERQRKAGRAKRTFPIAGKLFEVDGPESYGDLLARLDTLPDLKGPSVKSDESTRLVHPGPGPAPSNHRGRHELLTPAERDSRGDEARKQPPRPLENPAHQESALRHAADRLAAQPLRDGVLGPLPAQQRRNDRALRTGRRYVAAVTIGAITGTETASVLRDRSPHPAPSGNRRRRGPSSPHSPPAQVRGAPRGCDCPDRSARTAVCHGGHRAAP